MRLRRCAFTRGQRAKMKTKRYSELAKLQTFEERFKYLKLAGSVGIATFGFDRYLNQALYHSQDWKSVRNKIILRDQGCDLGIPGREIYGRAIIHHLNPLTEEDILERNPDIFNPEYLITVSIDTHNAIHYSDESILQLAPVERTYYDTCPWRSA